MTTARERARETALEKSGLLGDSQDFMDGADAASDVWEPLLHKAFEALRIVHVQTSEHDEKVMKVYHELWDALGMQSG